MDERLDRISRYLLAHSHASEIRPAAIGAQLLPYLFVLEIDRDPAGELSGLRIRLAGTQLERAFKKPLTGHRIEEFIHGPRGDDVIGTFHHCANTREPIWMRQVVNLQGRPPRSVEGIAVALLPDRIYGGLIIGETLDLAIKGTFEYRSLRAESAGS
jgi:hypothetical protein